MDSPLPLRAPRPLPLVLWSGRRVIGIASAVALLLALGYSAVVGRSYATTASFVVQSRRAPSGLGGLAAQIGLSLPNDQASQSPQFYADLLLSGGLLMRLTKCSVAPTDSSHGLTLVDYLRPGQGHEDERRELAVRRLRLDFISAPSVRSGTVTVRFSDRDRAVSFAVVGCALNLVDDYNQQIRRTTASGERRFVEGRVIIAADSLRTAEDALQEFLASNRSDLKSSPKLVFQYDRLNRHVRERQQLVTGMRELLEQARMEEMRDTPAISIVEPPRMPTLPDPGQLTRAAIIGLFIGAFLAALGLIVLDGWPSLVGRLSDLDSDARLRG